MTPIAFVEHRLPRRLRLRIPSKRRETSFFEDLVGHLAAVPSVLGLKANPLTGSLVIQHDGNAEAIVSYAARGGLIELRSVPEKSVRAGQVAPNMLVPAALSGLSLVQAARGQFTGAASENLWNAYAAHARFRNPWFTFLFLGLGALQLAKGQVLNSATALMFYALTAQEITPGGRDQTGRDVPHG